MIFHFAPIPFWGVHVCHVMRFLSSHDFILKDIRIKKYIHWRFQSVSRSFRVLNAFCLHVFRSFLYTCIMFSVCSLSIVSGGVGV